VRFFRGAGVDVAQVVHAELLDHPQRSGVGRAVDYTLHTHALERVGHASAPCWLRVVCYDTLSFGSRGGLLPRRLERGRTEDLHEVGMALCRCPHTIEVGPRRIGFGGSRLAALAARRATIGARGRSTMMAEKSRTEIDTELLQELRRRAQEQGRPEGSSSRRP
jgi:hypothetical protein